MHCNLFNIPSLDIWIFSYFIITNNAAINILVNKPFSIFWVVSLGQVPSKITGSKSNYIFILLNTYRQIAFLKSHTTYKHGS